MNQFEGRSSVGWTKSVNHQCEGIPYEFWLKLFGLIDNQLIDKVRDAAAKGAPLTGLIMESTESHKSPFMGQSLRKLIILTILSVISVKRFITILNSDQLINSFLGDVTGYWLESPIYYQFPSLVYLITSLLIITRYNSHENDLKCYLPFAPIPDQPIPCQCYKQLKYKTRIRLMTLTILIVNTAIMLITAYPVIIIVYNNPTNFPGNPMVAFIWLVVDCCVNQLALGIIMFSLLYFDLICLVIGNKFRSIEEIIDEAALQCIKRRKEPNIFTSLTSLFNNYLDINDIVTDSDHFWGKISFYIISSHTTLFLFVTYSFIYGETHPILKYLFIIIGSHSLFVLYKICQSCYDVSYAVSTFD